MEDVIEELVEMRSRDDGLKTGGELSMDQTTVQVEDQKWWWALLLIWWAGRRGRIEERWLEAWIGGR